MPEIALNPPPFKRGPGGEGRYLPLYEAKMIWHYDHRYGTYEGVRDRSSTQLPTPDERQHADPHFVVQPWYWVPAEEVQARLEEWRRGWLLGFRDVTNATNERTAIFSLLPKVGVGNKIPVLLFEAAGSIIQMCLLANACSIPFDYVVRQKLGGTTMNFFYVKQLPVLPPSAYTPADLAFIVPRALELTYTAWDLKPFADDVWNEADDGLRAVITPPLPKPGERGPGGEGHPPSPAARERRPGGESHPPSPAARERGPGDEGHPPSPAARERGPGGEGHPPSPAARERGLGGEGHPPSPAALGEGFPLPPFTWNEERRAVLRAELDAYYARLYGLTRKQLRYILDPADLTERELADILNPWEEVHDPLDPMGYEERVRNSTFPGETFRVLKEKELRQFGEYRTRRLILEAWERMER